MWRLASSARTIRRAAHSVHAMFMASRAGLDDCARRSHPIFMACFGVPLCAIYAASAAAADMSAVGANEKQESL